MGVITSSNQMQFKSCKSIFAQIRDELDSYDAQNLIDNRTLYRYVKKVISMIGIGYYMEKQAIIPVSRYKAKLPEDFYLLYSAYKTKSDITSVKSKPLPQQGTVMYLENTCETIEHCKCDIEKTIDKITVRTYIDEGILTYNFQAPHLLRLGTTSKYCSNESPNLYHTSSDEISIDEGYINTNFESGNIYIKYYGFPFDEQGYPMIPEDEEMKTAIEDYIKYKLFEKWWNNSEVPDIERRMYKAEANFKESMGDLITKVKTPSFQTMVDYKRSTSSRFDIYQFYRI